MFKIRKSSISLIYYFFSCKLAPAPQGRRSPGFRFRKRLLLVVLDESRKALAYGGGGKAEKGKENKKETLPPSVKEITPLFCGKNLLPEINFKFSKKIIFGEDSGKEGNFPR